MPFIVFTTALKIKKEKIKMRKKLEFSPTMTNEIQRKKLASGIMKNAIGIGSKLIAWIPVELLNIQPYQRKRQKHITQIAESWDNAKCNVLLVSYDEDNGWFNVMDGQHRAAAARMRGVEYLVCEIFANMTVSQEASMFVGINTGSKQLSPFDTYKANQFITGEEETELSKCDKEISALCKEYDIKVEKSNAAGVLKSVPVARKIMKRDGEMGLSFVFDVIKDSHWDTFPDGFTSDLMTSLGKIYFNHKSDSDTIKSRLCGFFINSTPCELAALSNNTYPNLTRCARLDAILADVIKEPEAPIGKTKSVGKKVA